MNNVLVYTKSNTLKDSLNPCLKKLKISPIVCKEKSDFDMNLDSNLVLIDGLFLDLDSVSLNSEEESILKKKNIEIIGISRDDNLLKKYKYGLKKPISIATLQPFIEEVNSNKSIVEETEEETEEEIIIKNNIDEEEILNEDELNSLDIPNSSEKEFMKEIESLNDEYLNDNSKNTNPINFTSKKINILKEIEDLENEFLNKTNKNELNEDSSLEKIKEIINIKNKRKEPIKDVIIENKKDIEKSIQSREEIIKDFEIKQEEKKQIDNILEYSKKDKSLDGYRVRKMLAMNYSKEQIMNELIKIEKINNEHLKKLKETVDSKREIYLEQKNISQSVVDDILNEVPQNSSTNISNVNQKLSYKESYNYQQNNIKQEKIDEDIDIEKADPIDIIRMKREKLMKDKANIINKESNKYNNIDKEGLPSQDLVSSHRIKQRTQRIEDSEKEKPKEERVVKSYDGLIRPPKINTNNLKESEEKEKPNKGFNLFGIKKNKK